MPEPNLSLLDRFISRSKFVDEKMIASLLLLTATVVALVWANESYSASYYRLWHMPITISAGPYSISHCLEKWVNDGLMSIFFFVIGLEIKRELLVGELSSRQHVILPAAAALGGMIMPAGLYVLINQGGPGIAGWGIPMATDIAFALGCMLALGRFVPLSLRVFLLALAIFDDMGAILIIALFYTETISLTSLGIGILILTTSWALNRSGVRETWPFALLGLGLWLAFLFSGIHATIAGVLLAFTIPARSLYYDQKSFVQETHDLMERFPDTEFERMMVDEKQREVLKHLQCMVNDLNSPLQKLEDTLYPFASYFIIPVFALANAGVNITQGSDSSVLASPIAFGIIIALFIGKPLGIMVFSWLAVRVRLTQLPEGVGWKQMLGAACLAGIGFTMSLFITNLAFADAAAINQAKIAVMIGSLCSAGLGFAIFLTSRGQQTV